MLPHHKRALNSPRRLVFRHAQRFLKSKSERPAKGQDPELKPGQEQLYSFYVPGLQARPYTIDVQQDVSAGEGLDSQVLHSVQTFTAVAPRFALPDNAIHSVYPPQGQQAEVEVLPHVIFNDPTMPWERVGSWAAENITPPSQDYYLRNRVPWLAVLVFTQDELQLPKSALQGPDSIFQDIPALQDGAKQGPTFAVNMSVSDMSKLRNTATPVVYEPETDAGATSDVIFLPPSLFVSLFTTYDKDGLPSQTQISGDVYRYRFLAHRRDIRTDGMAVSGTVQDDSGSFGVIWSHRTGPSSITQPTKVCVHLVSIEGVEEMEPWPVAAQQQFVAMSSLYSWSYNCLPPDVPNTHDLMASLGNTLNLLRPTLSADDGARISAQPMGERVLQRLNNGFSLARYRTQTGETTACFTRGPLIPDDVSHPLTDWWTSLSTCGTDLQILDQELGLMDITYSAAWQLGRTMAIADPAFTAALVRVRKQILDRAMNAAQASLLRGYGMYKSRNELIKSLGHCIERIGVLHKSGLLEGENSLRHRWRRASVQPLDLSYHGETISSKMEDALTEAALEVASTPDPEDPTRPSDMPYDELNTPFSPDWIQVLRWILDKLFLSSIPSHYLIADASHVPLESLRFFKIDPNWTDALLDGALSLANHIDQDDDAVRTAIKGAINRYLTTPIPSLGYLPPVPRYGCYVRSKLITQFPDMIVQIVPQPALDSAPVLLRHDIVDTGTMLCLFSEPPLSPAFTGLTFTQPPHQQTFRAATKITETYFETDYKRAYTVADPNDPDEKDPIDTNIVWTKGDPSPHGTVYIWDQVNPATDTSFDVRTLILENFASDYLLELNTRIPQYFQDQIATSALMAYEFNDPCYLLEIDLKTKIQLKSLFYSGEPEIRRTLPIRRRQPQKSSPALQDYRIDVESPAASHLTAANRATRKIPLVLPNPPPHIPMTRKLPTSVLEVKRKAPVKSARRARGPADLPVFNYFFWSADAPGKPTNQGAIPMRADHLPQDIIFSINLIRNAYDYLLESVSISIPLGQPIQRQEDNPGPLTTMPYIGPGATMLSNLRVNPLVSYSDDSRALIVTLFPRSTTGNVQVTRCKELSFMLSSVVVNLSPPSIGDVYVVPTITENYKGAKPQTPIQPNIRMVLRQQ